MMNNLKLYLFSDIHYSNKIPSWPIKQKLIEYSEALVNKIIEKINKEKEADICIHLGDLIQASNNKQEDMENLKYIWSKLRKINVPCYTLLGNHELKNMDNNQEILQILGYKQASFSIDIKGYHLIFCNTQVNKEDSQYKTQYLSNEDIIWLKEETARNKKCLIFFHFGIAEDNLKGNFWYEKDPEGAMLRNRNKIKKFLKSKNVMAIFTAHQHWTKTIIENGIPYFEIGSIIENTNEEDTPDGVYLEVELDENKITVTEKHLMLDKGEK